MNTPYWKKLQDPRWQRKRLEMLDDAGWKCQTCGAEDRRLEVHHICYRKGAEPWEYEQHELRVLCSEHHERLHEEVNPSMLNLASQLDPDVSLELVDRIFSALNRRVSLDRKLGKTPAEIVNDIFDSEELMRRIDSENAELENRKGDL